MRAAQFLSSKVRVDEGVVGYVSDILLDDETWSVIHFVADLTPWQKEEDYLLGPQSLRAHCPEKSEAVFGFSMLEIKRLPRVSEDEPVSYFCRRHLQNMQEAGLLNLTKAMAPEPPALNASVSSHGQLRSPGGAAEIGINPHLQSFRELKGYRVKCGDQVVGSLSDLEFELPQAKVLSLRARLPEKDMEILVNPDWVQEISFEKSEVLLHITHDYLTKNQNQSTWPSESLRYKGKEKLESPKE